MKKVVILLLFCFTILSSKSQNLEIQQMVNNVNGDSIWHYIEVLSGMERYTTANNDEAAEYLSDFFKNLGFDTVYYHNYISGWTPNVIAEKRGILYPDSIYVVGAHYDTYTTGAPGADDNASGTAGVMELGRAIVEHDFNKTMRLLCFSGEELGLVGSEKYAQKCAQQGENIVAMINLDMISHSETGSEYPEIWVASNYYSDWIFNDLKQALFTYSISADWADGSSSMYAYASDHASFWNENIPAIFLNDCLDIYSPNHNIFIHTFNDILGTSSNNQELAVTSTAVATVLMAEYSDIAETTGVRDYNIDKAGFLAYPNPVVDLLTILLKDRAKDISIYSVDGHKVMGLEKPRPGNNTINCRGLHKGMYIIRVYFEDGSHSNGRMIKL